MTAAPLLAERWPRAMGQKMAATYCGMSDRTFRREQPVEPRPVKPPRPGEKPMLKYFREDLDAYLDRMKQFRLGGSR